uniref:Cytochrome P450 n=1 Tax=Tetranychus urticae TaxID=32264 RepID=T1JZS5_TETUR
MKIFSFFLKRNRKLSFLCMVEKLVNEKCHDFLDIHKDIKDVLINMLLDHFNVNMTLFNIFCGCLTVWLIKYLFNFISRLHKLPPGPWGLPFVGYLQRVIARESTRKNDKKINVNKFFDEKKLKKIKEKLKGLLVAPSRPRPFPYPYLKKIVNIACYLFKRLLAKKYGPVFSFKFGELDVNDHLFARLNTTFIPEFKRASSLLEMSGEPWKQQRRVALTILRNVGFGKLALEEKLKQEINMFIDSLKSANGAAVDFGEVIKLSVANNISISQYERLKDNSFQCHFLFKDAIVVCKRFLSEDGTTVIKSPYLMPFNGGKMICSDATLSLTELFLW